MNRSAILRNTLFGLVVLMLIGGLAFLYHKTQTIDLHDQNVVLGLLNDLQDIDAQWDNEIQGARMGNDLANAHLVNRTSAAIRALRGIGSIAQQTSSTALNKGLPTLSKAILQKAELVDRFNNENLNAQTALRQLSAQMSQLQTQLAADHNLAPHLNAPLAQLAATAPLFYQQQQDAQRDLLLAAAQQLAQVPDALREPVAQILAHLQILLDHPSLAQNLNNELEGLTAGARLMSMRLAYNNEMEFAFQEKERYRIYLVYYSGALLLLLGYLGLKLRAVNQRLEQRVEQRTIELSAALKHLKESEAQLIQSEKMSSLGQMVAGVAHEINTPLAYVKNSLGRVAEQLPVIGEALIGCEKLLGLLQAGNDPKELSRQFGLVSAQVAQLKQEGVIEELNGLVNDGLFGTGQVADIVANLKNFSRLDRSKVTQFNLNEGLESTLLLAKHLLKTVRVDKQFGEIPNITCSPSQINQVFLNLVTNAAQALPEGKGKITLTTRIDSEGVAVDVADDGSGIPAEVLSKIFDPFFTTKEIGKGTGLGLSISYKIIAEHGGKISVVSRPGYGTKFTVWLPLKATDAVVQQG